MFKDVVLSVSSFKSKKGNDIILLKVLHRYSVKDEIRCSCEEYFLPADKFQDLAEYHGGEVVEISYTRDYRGNAIPLAVSFEGEYNQDICNFLQGEEDV